MSVIKLYIKKVSSEDTVSIVNSVFVSTIWYGIVCSYCKLQTVL